MLSRSLRPLTTRATGFTANPIRSRILLGPFCIRTFADRPPYTVRAPPGEDAPRRLPYFVGRNTLNNFSIYHKRKAAGTLKLTLLKHCTGDLGALTRDLGTTLQLSWGDIYINSLTKHIIIKGHRRDEVVHFFRTLGF
ncbi:hypothetical protein ANO14919_029060 [Xylariales sp. No.14919]|nr:mitochondrial large subunit ribosomal protein-domain-containing protein [Xylaria grammica]GAW13520.1 hypothetical protein ANO14919_029060 [Xylariales sp. No.14919]